MMDLQITPIHCSTIVVFAFIHAQSGQWATYQPLEKLEKQLNSAFIRVHRSFLVNIKQIKTIKEVYDRTYEIELRDFSQKIPMSRNAYSKHRHCFK
jgi:DNA-binding LytR/AlgR family response regulator